MNDLWAIRVAQPINVAAEVARESGMRTVVVSEPVAINSSNPDLLKHLLLLRESMAHGVSVSWQATEFDGSVDVNAICHLLPPRQGSNDDGLDAWRQRYRFGLCYYRVGPGFRAIKDMRRTDGRWSAVAEDPGLIALFDRCLSPAPVPSEEVDSALLDELTEAEILFVHQDKALTLPFRMRRWPIPYDAV